MAEYKKRFLSLLTAGIMTLCAACTADTKKSDTTSASDITCESLVKTAVDSIEFPVYEVSSDKEIADAYGIDLSLTDDWSIAYQLLSVDLAEVIVVQAKDENSDAIMTALLEHKDYLINMLAIYPNTVEAAESTVVGSSGNFVWLICHKDAKTAETAITNLL